MELRNVPIGEIIVKDRLREDLGELLTLIGSIERVGLIHPIVLNSKMELVSGGRRLEAVKKLKWTEVPALIVTTFDDAVKALQAEVDENSFRKQLTIYEASKKGERLEALLGPVAEKRKSPGTNQHTKRSAEIFPETSKGDTRDIVGEALGISGRTYEKMKSIASEGLPALVHMVDDQQVSVDAAATVAKLPKTEQAKIVAKGPEAVKKAAKKAKAERIADYNAFQAKRKPKPTEPADDNDPQFKRPRSNRINLSEIIARTIDRARRKPDEAKMFIIRFRDAIEKLEAIQTGEGQ